MKLHWWMRKWRYGTVLEKVQAGAIIMDVGCGTHHQFLDLVQDKVGKGYGIDKKIKPYKEPTVEAINFNFDGHESVTFPIPDCGKVNQVFMLAVIEHVHHAESILNGIYDSLSEGGELMITTPTTLSKPVLEFLSYRLKLINEDEIRDHKHYFSRDELIELLDKTGFEEINHRYFQFRMNQMITASKPPAARRGSVS